MPDFEPGKFCASVALGALDVSPLEMASAYGVFANHGGRQEPTPVLRVWDRQGKLILDNTEREPEAVLKVEVADNVTDILRGVLTSGTAAGKGIDRPAAGKTGTTQDNKDSWFVGYTPTLSTAVWLGYENKPGTPHEVPARDQGRRCGDGRHPSRQRVAALHARGARGRPGHRVQRAGTDPEVADDERRAARRFFDPGPRMYPRGGGLGGPYVTDLPPPRRRSTVEHDVDHDP